jgi:hypothetical protein
MSFSQNMADKSYNTPPPKTKVNYHVAFAQNSIQKKLRLNANYLCQHFESVYLNC